jgi:hypothetical protein
LHTHFGTFYKQPFSNVYCLDVGDENVITGGALEKIGQTKLNLTWLDLTW